MLVVAMEGWGSVLLTPNSYIYWENNCNSFHGNKIIYRQRKVVAELKGQTWICKVLRYLSWGHFFEVIFNIFNLTLSISDQESESEVSAHEKFTCGHEFLDLLISLDERSVGFDIYIPLFWYNSIGCEKSIPL